MKKRKKNRYNPKQKRMERTEGQEFLELLDQDENFYFIADYTDGGVPYGITWEEYYQNIYEFTDKEYYYISEVSDDGNVIGITWIEYLKELDKDFMGQIEEDE